MQSTTRVNGTAPSPQLGTHDRTGYIQRAEMAGREYLAAVDSILETVREGRGESESNGRVPDRTIEAMTEAGVFRALTPLQYGGLEMNPAAFFEGIMKIAGADASAAWIGGQLNVHSFEIALMDPRFQDEFWADGPDTRASSSYAPTGTWTSVEGGYLLDGTWGFSSGVDHAQWIIVGGSDRNFVVPAKDFSIAQDSWNVSGLKGTGSKTVTITRAFVPEYRTHLLSNTYQNIDPGLSTNDRPLYRCSFMSIFNSTMANSAIGATLGGLEGFIADSKTRRARRGTGVSVTENPHLMVKLASAYSLVETIKKRHLDHWRDLFNIACEGTVASPLKRMQVRFDAADAIALSLNALEEIWPVAGATSILSTNHLQQVVRDLHAMRVHGSAGREAAATLYSRCLLGIEGPSFEENPSMRALAYHR